MTGTLLALALALAAAPDPPSGPPDPTRDVRFEPEAGAAVALDAPLTDSRGLPTTLRAELRGRPLLLVPVYFDCPALCPLTLGRLFSALERADLVAGRDVDVVAWSFDPTEGPADAERRRRELPEDGRRESVRFLTGSPQAVESVARSIGFTAVPTPDGEIAHASALVALTGEGRISSWLVGLDVTAADVAAAVEDAAAGRSPERDLASGFLLLCSRFAPEVGRFSGAVLALARLGGVATVLGIAALVWLVARGRPPGRADRGKPEAA